MPISLKHGTYVRTHEGSQDDNCIVTFSHDAVLDQAATDRAGRAIFRDVEMIEISFPGNQLFAFSEKVNDSHRQRFPRQYEAFLAGDEVAHDGTPIEQLTVLSRAHVKELKHLGIYSIEAGADLTEQAVQAIGMGGSKIRAMCRAYIEQANGVAPIAKLVAETESLRDRNAALEASIADLNNMMMGMQRQLADFNRAPQMPMQVIPGVPDVMNLGTDTGSVASSLDTLGDAPRRGPGRPRKAA